MQTYRNCSSSGEDKQALISIILMFRFYLKPTLLRWWKTNVEFHTMEHISYRQHILQCWNIHLERGWDHTHRKALLTECHHWTSRAVDSLCHDVNNHHFKSTEPPIRGPFHSKFYNLEWKTRTNQGSLFKGKTKFLHFQPQALPSLEKEIFLAPVKIPLHPSQSKTSSLWTFVICSPLQCTEHKNSQAQKRFLPQIEVRQFTSLLFVLHRFS